MREEAFFNKLAGQGRAQLVPVPLLRQLESNSFSRQPGTMTF